MSYIASQSERRFLLSLRGGCSSRRSNLLTVLEIALGTPALAGRASEEQERPRNDAEVIMEIGETIYVTTREEFREWLEKNHKIRKEIWLIQYKKVTGKPSIPYAEAVEEAICFGWIDGFEKGMDDQRFAKRFTPRRQKSLWTETNIERARKMIEEGKMTEVGRATLPKGV